MCTLMRSLKTICTSYALTHTSFSSWRTQDWSWRAHQKWEPHPCRRAQKLASCDSIHLRRSEKQSKSRFHSRLSRGFVTEDPDRTVFAVVLVLPSVCTFYGPPSAKLKGLGLLQGRPAYHRTTLTKSWHGRHSHSNSCVLKMYYGGGKETSVNK